MFPPGFHAMMTCAEARDFERSFFSGDPDGSPVRAFMRLAAAGVARETQALIDEVGSDSSRVIVLCGKGRNAGDALLAAAELMGVGSECRVCLACGRDGLGAEADWALRRLESMVGVSVRCSASFDDDFARRPCVVLDGLTGSGFRPPLSGGMRDLVLAANRCEGALRVAVDLPSGAGDISDALLFHAHLTVATGIMKAPLLQGAVRRAAGRIRYVDFGFFDNGAPPSRVTVPAPAAFLSLDCLRDAFSDKRDFGHVAVLGGHRTMPGALLMNVFGALRAGAGLVTAFCPLSVHSAFAAAAPEAMWVPLPETEEGSLSSDSLPAVLARLARADVLVCGSGLGGASAPLGLIAQILGRTEIPAVVDADALRPEVIVAMRARPSGAGPVVLTPHPGEFRRISGREAGDGFDSLSAFARDAGAIVVLKGPGTRVSDGARDVFIPYGGPVLARGGSGDLLAGMIGAVLARDEEPGLPGVATAVAWHGAAADFVARRRGAVAIRATDVLDGLGPCLRSMRGV